MPRSATATVFAVCLLGVLAPAAAAKELQGATICGAERCVDVPKDDLGFELIEGNSYATPPKHAERFYRVELRIGGGGHSETLELVLLPRLAYLSDFGGRPNTWLALYDDGARSYRQLTAPLEPFPAADTTRMLAAADSGPDRDPLPPSSPAAASPPLADAGKDGGDGIAIAGIVAGVALVGVVGLSLVRRNASAR
jgi:hypothetical protein